VAESPLSRAALEAVEAAARSRAVVFGSLPPHGRDLDLLVRESDAGAVRRALVGAGAVARGTSELALFGGGSAYAVDVVPVEQWKLPAAESHALFDEAVPIEGFEQVARPSPAHTVLLLARIGLTEKRRPRLDAALAEDPLAWERAAERAAAWGVDLETLRRAPARRPPLPRLPRVVALSGLDGSGKSTQSTLLAAALESLGYDVRVEWMPILQNSAVARLSTLARRLLRLVRPRRAAEAAATGASLVARTDPSGAGSGGAVRFAWTTYVATVNALTHLRHALHHRGHRVVLLQDRFVLDSVARIRFLYGRDERFPVQRRILQLLSPRPAAAVWLDVPAEVAYARKPEHWDEAALAAQRQLYAEEHEELGVRRLDGTRPPEELAAEIAAHVWLRL
jgi:thymidylate kinase